jgi:hypothetical protein
LPFKCDLQRYTAVAAAAAAAAATTTNATTVLGDDAEVGGQASEEEVVTNRLATADIHDEDGDDDEDGAAAASIEAEGWGEALAHAKRLVADGVATLSQRRESGGWSGEVGGLGDDEDRANDKDEDANDAALLAAAADRLDAACTSAGRLRAIATAPLCTANGRHDDGHDDKNNGGDDSVGSNSGGGGEVIDFDARAWRADMTHGEALLMRAQCRRLQGNHAATVRDSGLACKLFDRATERPTGVEEPGGSSGGSGGGGGRGGGVRGRGGGRGGGGGGGTSGADGPDGAVAAQVVTRADLVAGLCGDLRAVAAAADAWPPLRRQVDALLAGAEARLERAEARVAIADAAGAAAAAAEAYEAFDVLGDDRGRARARTAVGTVQVESSPRIA